MDLQSIKHIAFIMDGNGRWAISHKMRRSQGHNKGMETFKKIVRECIKRDIKYMTFYAFSTENWNRSEEEIDNLFNLTRRFIKEVKANKENNCRFIFIGNKQQLPTDINKEIKILEESTKCFDKANIIIALNYGAREEILNAANLAITLGLKKVSKEEFENLLYTKEIPDPDIIIRTG